MTKSCTIYIPNLATKHKIRIMQWLTTVKLFRIH